MPDNAPLTTEELYGKSDPPHPEKPLVYEETPILDPIAPSSPLPTPPRPKAGNVFKTFGTILLFVVLFGIGVWLSAVIRPYLPSSSLLPQATPTIAPVEIPVTQTSPTVSSDPYATWNLVTIGPASLRLPQSVASPICDGAACGSQGTYLPGGTRLTMATHDNARQFSQGAVIVDSGGRSFTTTEVMVAGRRAFAYQGLFSGTTTGGYTFSQMRGVMILLDDTQTLELNHFTPTGVTADFVSDDRLFDEILKTLILASPTQ